MRGRAELFARVGGMDDDDAVRRHAVSLAVTGALGAVAIVASLIGASAWAVAEPAALRPEGEPVVLVEAPPAAETPLPALPLPVAPPADRGPDGAEAAAPRREVPAAASSAGTANEEAGGTAAPTDGGCLGCDVRAVIRSTVQPEYPDAALALGLAVQRCTARVEVDEDGVPGRVDVSGCPEAFHQATREGVFRWRWYPPRALGVPSRAVVTVAVTYRLADVPAGDAG